MCANFITSSCTACPFIVFIVLLCFMCYWLGTRKNTELVSLFHFLCCLKRAAIGEQKRLKSKKVLSDKKAFRRSRSSWD